MRSSALGQNGLFVVTAVHTEPDTADLKLTGPRDFILRDIPWGVLNPLKRTDGNEPLSREQMDAIVKDFDRKIEKLNRVERSADWHKLMDYYVREREKMVNLLKRIDSTDVF